MRYEKIGIIVVVIVWCVGSGLCVVNDGIEFIKFYCVVVCVFFFDKGIDCVGIKFEYCKSDCEMCEFF